VAGTRTSWITGTALAGVVVLAAGWFLLISPLRAETGTTRDATEAQEAQNDARELALIRLQEEFGQLGEYRAELAGLQAAIPVQAELPALTREVQEVAERTGVTILQMTSATPVAVAEPAVVTDTGTAADGDTADSSGGAAPGGGTSTVSGVESMQVGFTVIGSYEAVARFVADVQTGTERLFLVSAITATSLDEAAAGAGRPATATGDVEASFTAYAFMLPASGAVDATAGADEGQGSLPESDRDPFIPLD
jgi:Tfp pilus assembly protein PilO